MEQQVTQRKVILYIAMSLDGYIAKGQDDIDFLSVVDTPGEDFGYFQFQSEIDTIIWGRKTYDKVLTLPFGNPFPHSDKKVYVISRTRTGSDENVTYVNKPIQAFLADLKAESGKHIYIDGGAGLVYELLKDECLIDEFIVSVIPHLVGSGVRLFKDGLAEHKLKFKRSLTYPGGLVQLHYVKGL